MGPVDKARWVGAGLLAVRVGIGEEDGAAAERVREIIRATDARVDLNVKWNSPNFALGGVDFATLNLRPGKPVRVVLHMGAKADPAP